MEDPPRLTPAARYYQKVKDDPVFKAKQKEKLARQYQRRKEERAQFYQANKETLKQRALERYYRLKAEANPQ
jgi:hypothetical protein